MNKWIYLAEKSNKMKGWMDEWVNEAIKGWINEWIITNEWRNKS